MKNVNIALNNRKDLDQLLAQRRAAEEEAANRHGIDLNQFGVDLDDRVYNAPEVIAVQKQIDAIYGH